MLASREGERRSIEVRHRRLVRVALVAKLEALGEGLLGGGDVAAMELDVAEVVQLDGHHALVAQAPVQLEALAVEPSRVVELAGEPRSGGEQVQRGDAGRWSEIVGQLSRLAGEPPDAPVVAVAEGDTAEADERQRLRLAIADRPRDLE